VGTLEELWPPFGLRVSCGPLTLRVVRDDDLPALVEVVEGGIHDPGRMPFYFPWTDATGDVLRQETLRFFWRSRADRTSPGSWSLPLGVWRDDELVGIQEIATKDFPVTRTGETGSWLGLRFQGLGTGTLMRQVICVLAFDHLGFTEVTSGAFTDNPQSLAVSRKVGYVDNGRVRLKRRKDEQAVNQQLLLTPSALVRPPYPVVVEGVEPLRAFLGTDVAAK
jgi:RimJ/RimL family protein N-acetyltransferase